MAKITAKYLEFLVNKELNRLLKEDDDGQQQTGLQNNPQTSQTSDASNSQVNTNQKAAQGNNDEMTSFVSDEIKDLTSTIYNDGKVMSAVQNPMERNLKQKTINVNKSKLKNLTKIQDDLKKQADANKKSLTTKQTHPQTQQPQIQPQMGALNTNLQEQQLPVQAPQTPPVAPAKKKIVYNVAFDVKGKQPFNVKFSERGFDINGTRLSFELLETAASKNFSITLEGGKGLVLDAVRMQKILRYKDRFSPKIQTSTAPAPTV